MRLGSHASKDVNIRRSAPIAPPPAIVAPIPTGVGSKPVMQHHEHSRVCIIYHEIDLLTTHRRPGGAYNRSSVHPLGVEYAFAVGAAVCVRAKEVTLSLGQVGW